MSTMTPDKSDDLRAAFGPEQIGKLPRSTCKECSRSSTKVCSDHSKRKCEECGNYMTTQHIHLDYVGHAVVTDRFLKVDPWWTWEPYATDQYGAPLVTINGKEAVLWIKLTILGVTRPGVGIVPVDSFERDKQLIGDALRNAGMRFGVALELWSKQDLDTHEGTNELPVSAAQAKTEIIEACGGDMDIAQELWGDRGSNPISREDLDELISHAPAESQPGGKE